MKQILGAVSVIFVVVSLITVSFTFSQVRQEEERLESDIQYRSYLLSNSLKESVEPNFINKSDPYLQGVVERFVDQQRIAGLAIVDNTGKIIAVSSSLPKEISEAQKIATDVMDADTESGDFVTVANKKMYVFASPLHEEKSVVGSLIVIQNASYINTRLLDIWKNNLMRLFVQSLIVSIVVLLILRWVIYAPIRKLVEAMQLTRRGVTSKTANKIFDNPIFQPLIQEVGNMQLKLIEARIATSEEARLSLEKIDSPWTPERLKQFSHDILKKRNIVVVSLREPYIHTKVGNKIEYHMPANGLVSGIEPIMEACGGLWIAEGSGNADRLVVDKHDKIQAPPDDPKYTLKRVWLSEEESRGFYSGASKQALYPLSHMVYIRPTFRDEDWKQYKIVNEKFAQTVLKEIKGLHKPIVLIQDFHFTLLPQLIKKKRPDATIQLFWHVPWTTAEAFSICPWKKEILEGMLGADLLGFHTQAHCNNFITTVGRELEALIDFEQFTITRNSHISLVRAFPISTTFTGGQAADDESKEEREKEKQELLRRLGIKSQYIGIGIDRLDQIKGLLERIKALEIFFKNYPEFKEQITFIQISVPLHSSIRDPQGYATQVKNEIERVNNLFKTNQWKPIVLIQRRHTHKELEAYYKLADFCLITSMHDGMNLVAKEYVAAKDDEQGVLILSQFAGASKELKDALVINPYDGVQGAEAIHTAITMSPEEQAKRMKKMRTVVKNYNIYRWAAEILKTLVSIG